MLKKMFTPLTISLICAVVLLNSTAQIFLKAAALSGMKHGGGFMAVLLNVWYLASLCTLGLAFLCWQKALKYLPLSFAHPFCSLTYLFIPLLSWAIFGEEVSVRYFVGVACICIGIFLTASGAVKGHG